jgi:hypothetical protein
MLFQETTFLWWCDEWLVQISVRVDCVGHIFSFLLNGTTAELLYHFPKLFADAVIDL